MAKKCSKIEPTVPADITDFELDGTDLEERSATIKWNGIADTDWGTDENGKQIDPATAGNCKYVISWRMNTVDSKVYSVAMPWDACYAKDQVEHTITKLLTNRLYHYGIVAVNGNDGGYNTSDNPVEGTFELIEPTPPAGVAGGSIEHEIDESELTVTFTWIGIEDDKWGTDEKGEQIDPATAGNCKYVISLYISGTKAGSGDVAWDEMREYTTPELLADTEYHYIVEAVNGNDDKYNSIGKPAVCVFKTPKAKTEDL